jgi:hypothetical protein
MQVNLKEEPPMKYNKPELRKLHTALDAIQNSQAKPGRITPDAGVPKMLGTPSAYEADE